MKQPTKLRVLVAETDHLLAVTFRFGLVGSLVLAVLAASSAAATASAPQRPARADLDAFEKVDLDTLAEKYRDFYNEIEVILTAAEEDVFLRLESDFQRDEFMERFWRVRDPSAGTPRNEYKEEYEKRLEHVEKHFGRGVPGPGRKTDQGRMYLLLGEPMNIKSLPYEQQLRPVEMWWFHANPRLGIPPFFYLVFFKRNGVGQFRLYSPLVDGPMALLNPSGVSSARGIQSGEAGYMSQTEGEIGAALDVLKYIDAELAQAALSLIPGDYGGQVGYGSMRSQMMMGDIESIPETIMPTAFWAYPILTGMVEADVRFETMPIQAQAIALLDPSGVPFVHYGLLTDGNRLNLNNYEDSWYVTFQVAGTLVDDQNRIVTSVKGADGSSTKVLQADLDEAEARNLRSGPLLYLDRFPVVAGRYDFDLILENNVSREYGRASFAIDVPAPWPEVVRSSRPLLLWAVFEDPQYDPYAEHYPFQVGRYDLIPALEPVFDQAKAILVFQQLYLPRGHQGFLEATYRLSNGSETLIDRIEYIDPADADSNGTINHIATIVLEDIAAGEYELFVDLDGDDRGGTTYTLTVDPEAEIAPHLHMNAGPPPTDPWFAFDRAQQLRTLAEIDAAIEVLQTAVERVNDEEILALQIDLLMEAERYQDLEALLMPMQRARPNDTDMLMALAAVNSRMGNNGQAIRWYERVRLATRPEERVDVLNPLASAYFGDGNHAKAREMLEKSLAVDPDQPEIRTLLDQVLGRGGGASR
ncbi:MAG: GWxTD domain-containing protein [Acidobacteria bacterium]|nr:GWxTD domain-containing protein [Acidobacteriota bacterium]